MAIVVEKIIDLSYLGENWAGATLTFAALSFRDVKELAALQADSQSPEAQTNAESFDQMIKLLEKKFVRGQAWDGEQIVAVKSTEIADFPVEVINKVMETLGGTSPNSSEA